MLLLLPVAGTKSGLDKFHLKEWFSLKMAELDLFYNGFQSTDVTRWCDVGLVNSLASVLPGGPCHI